MIPRVVLRRDVPADLESILDYLGSHNSAAADRFANVLAATLDDLAAMPGKGSLKSFRSKDFTGVRSWSVAGFRNYLILYRPIDEGIEVLAIVHGSRNLAKLLKDRV
jgi:plasmid stabilization system protein ParE